jgi:hypothetical protein
MRHENRDNKSISQMYAEFLINNEGYENLQDSSNLFLIVSPVDQPRMSSRRRHINIQKCNFNPSSNLQLGGIMNLVVVSVPILFVPAGLICRCFHEAGQNTQVVDVCVSGKIDSQTWILYYTGPTSIRSQYSVVE